jgi:hypothetical protein
VTFVKLLWAVTFQKAVVGNLLWEKQNLFGAVVVAFGKASLTYKWTRPVMHTNNFFLLPVSLTSPSPPITLSDDALGSWPHRPWELVALPVGAGRASQAHTGAPAELRWISLTVAEQTPEGKRWCGGAAEGGCERGWSQGKNKKNQVVPHNQW